MDGALNCFFLGKAFLRRLYEKLSVFEKTQVKRIAIDEEMKKDLLWWKGYFVHAKDIRINQIVKRQTFSFIIESDASSGFGMGAFMEPNFLKIETPLHMKNENIAVLEMYAITLAISTWKEKLRGKSFVIRIDNTVAAYGLRDLKSKNKNVMKLVRLVAMMALELKCRYFVQWIPTDENSVSDALSRNWDKKFRFLIKRRGQVANELPDKPFWDKRVHFL
ncbi:MAG: hypothetical protein GY714_19315 [Desulfobacterales bacterium]|nr:hypothetical protein [Desulfobacterales bacterium]